MESALAYSDTREDYELINGEVYMMSRPSIEHNDIAFNILSVFKKYLRGKKCRAFGEVDVFLDEENNFVPDAMIVCNPDIIKKDGIHGAPDLVVEILSPSSVRHDRFEKFQIYEKNGVKEYWIVDPTGKLVEVYHLVDGKFVIDGVYHPYSDEDLKYMLLEKERAEAAEMKMIKVSLYNDFIIDVADIFEDID